MSGVERGGGPSGEDATGGTSSKNAVVLVKSARQEGTKFDVGDILKFGLL